MSNNPGTGGRAILYIIIAVIILGIIYYFATNGAEPYTETKYIDGVPVVTETIKENPTYRTCPKWEWSGFQSWWSGGYCLVNINGRWIPQENVVIYATPK